MSKKEESNDLPNAKELIQFGSRLPLIIKKDFEKFCTLLDLSIQEGLAIAIQNFNEMSAKKISNDVPTIHKFDFKSTPPIIVKAEYRSLKMEADKWIRQHENNNSKFCTEQLASLNGKLARFFTKHKHSTLAPEVLELITKIDGMLDGETKS